MTDAHPAELAEVMRKHRNNLMLAIRSLPIDEVQDLVIAGLDAHSQQDKYKARAFLRRVEDWAWKYE